MIRQRLPQQLCGAALIHLLEYFEVSQSSSQTVGSHDNAVAEAFFPILKRKDNYYWQHL